MASSHGETERGLRIALFHTTLPQSGRKPGGVEVAVHRLANALVDLGKDEVTVLSATDAPLDARYRVEKLFARTPWLSRHPLARILVLPALLNFVDFRRFDLVHFHGDDWFLVRRHTKTVRTLHGSALREAQNAARPALRAFYGGVYMLEHLSARLSSIAVAGGGDAATFYGLDRVVRYGVDDAFFFPGDKHQTPRVLYVGTWKGRKRGQFVYDSFLRDVLPRVPTAQLCMVSDYCPPHPRVLHELFPTDRVLAGLYREAWVFALGSTYEGFGIPYLEALASATSVVTTPNPGAREILGNGRYGVLADDAFFGTAIANLLLSDERRRSLEAAGLRRAAGYSWEAVAAEHRSLYVEVIRGCP
jgi:phosphatidyl-myo-inositol alpha-mannosyltransferase